MGCFILKTPRRGVTIYNPRRKPGEMGVITHQAPKGCYPARSVTPLRGYATCYAYNPRLAPGVIDGYALFRAHFHVNYFESNKNCFENGFMAFRASGAGLTQ